MKTIKDLRKQLDAKEVSSLELTRKFLDKIKQPHRAWCF